MRGDRIISLLSRVSRTRIRYAGPVLLIVALAFVARFSVPELFDSGEAASLTGSGTIEADEVAVSAEFGGPIVSLFVAEGEQVQEGQELARLDDVFAETDVAQAEASMELAQADLDSVTISTSTEGEIQHQRVEQAKLGIEIARLNLAHLKESPRGVDIALSQATADQAIVLSASADNNSEAVQSINEKTLERVDKAVADAEANLERVERLALLVDDEAQLAVEAAETTLESTEDLLDEVEDLNDQGAQGYDDAVEARTRLQRDQAESALELAEAHLLTAEETNAQNISAAEDLLEQSKLDQALAEATAAQAQEIAQAAVASAAEGVAIAQARHEQLLAGASHSEIAVSDAQIDQARAGVDIAQATLESIEDRAEPAVNQASARLKQAEAVLDAARIKREKSIVRSPVTGTVLIVPVAAGEVTAPGATIAVIGDLSTVSLTIFISEPDLGNVELGQNADVSIDSQPGDVFKGRVAFIASEAEFTPRNIQTKEERTTLVFRVKIRLENDAGLFKIGMPADAELKGG